MNKCVCTWNLFVCLYIYPCYAYWGFGVGVMYFDGLCTLGEWNIVFKGFVDGTRPRYLFAFICLWREKHLRKKGNTKVVWTNRPDSLSLTGDKDFNTLAFLERYLVTVFSYHSDSLSLADNRNTQLARHYLWTWGCQILGGVWTSNGRYNWTWEWGICVGYQ